MIETNTYERNMLSLKQAKAMKEFGLSMWCSYLWADGKFMLYSHYSKNTSPTTRYKAINSELPKNAYTANSVKFAIDFLSDKYNLQLLYDPLVSYPKTLIALRIRGEEKFIFKHKTPSKYPKSLLLNKAIEYLTVYKKFTRIK